MFCSDFLYFVKKNYESSQFKIDSKKFTFVRENVRTDKTSVRTNFSDKMSVVTFCPKFYPYGRFVRKNVRTDKISDGHSTISAVFGRNLSQIRPLSAKNGRKRPKYE